MVLLIVAFFVVVVVYPDLLSSDTAIFTFLFTFVLLLLLPFLILNKIRFINPLLGFLGGGVGVRDEVLLDRRRYTCTSK